MADLSKEQVKQMAQLAGLDLDDVRAETICLRLSAVLTELDEIPSDSLMEVDPALTYITDVEGQS